MPKRLGGMDSVNIQSCASQYLLLHTIQYAKRVLTRLNYTFEIIGVKYILPSRSQKIPEVIIIALLN